MCVVQLFQYNDIIDDEDLSLTFLYIKCRFVGDAMWWNTLLIPLISLQNVRLYGCNVVHPFYSEKSQLNLNTFSHFFPSPSQMMYVQKKLFERERRPFWHAHRSSFAPFPKLSLPHPPPPNIIWSFTHILSLYLSLSYSCLSHVSCL